MDDFAREADGRTLWSAVFGTFLAIFGLVGMAVADRQYSLFLALGGVLLAWRALHRRINAPRWLLGLIIVSLALCMLMLIRRVHL